MQRRICDGAKGHSSGAFLALCACAANDCKDIAHAFRDHTTRSWKMPPCYLQTSREKILRDHTLELELMLTKKNVFHRLKDLGGKSAARNDALFYRAGKRKKCRKKYVPGWKIKKDGRVT